MDASGDSEERGGRRGRVFVSDDAAGGTIATGRGRTARRAPEG